MFGKTWHTSERKYDIIVEHDVKIRMSDGVELNADVFRPKSKEKFPAIFGFHPYRQQPQTAPIKTGPNSTNVFKNPGQEQGNAFLEAGDPNFFVRRGYAHIIVNVRGTGKSGGKYDLLRQREIKDGVEAFQWASEQSWCNGKVSMFGVSYFAMIQFRIAMAHPPQLKCIFAPWALTDHYRDWFYRGGILSQGFLRMWAGGSIYNARVESVSRKILGEEKLKKSINDLLQNEEIQAFPELIQILKNPEIGNNPLVIDQLVMPLNGEYWEERKVQYDLIEVPAYIGADWGNYGLHLPAAFRSWENLNVPKKMIITPPAYLDRPLYQLQYESLRWFDYWLKGENTGIIDESPIKLFIMGTGRWKDAKEWPLPETKWTPFYLHENGLLSEHEFWPNESFDNFDDSPWYRGSLSYVSPTLVEDTEVIGPIVANLYASTTDIEVLWYVTLSILDQQGNESALTKGWLRGSHREVDSPQSKPWYPYHPHNKSEPLIPGETYEFNIPIVPTGMLFKAGTKIKIKVSCSDDPPKNPLEAIAGGNLKRETAARITIYHDANHPSHILLPILEVT